MHSTYTSKGPFYTQIIDHVGPTKNKNREVRTKKNALQIKFFMKSLKECGKCTRLLEYQL